MNHHDNTIYASDVSVYSSMLLLQVIDNYYSFHHQKVERVSKLPSTHREEGLAAEPNVRLNYLIRA